MANSVFDRLAHQGTAASKARLAEEKEKEVREMQRRSKEAAATIPRENPAKLKHLKPPQVKSPRRTLKQQDAFFSRLAKQETASSAAHHTNDHSDKGVDGHHHHPVKSPTAKSPKNSEVFNRLYKQETAASKAHHFKEDTNPVPQVPKNVKPAPPPSLLKRLEQKKTSENNNHPPIPIEMKLHIRTKEGKASGEKSYSGLNLSHDDVRKQINLYHSGKVSAHALAFDIINALFDRDFKPGAHWEIDSAHLDTLDPLVDKTLLDGIEVGDKLYECFDAEKKATWDWKDIYSVATAKAIIKISKDNIYVDEYSYYVAG